MSKLLAAEILPLELLIATPQIRSLGARKPHPSDPFRGASSEIARILGIWRNSKITEVAGIPEKSRPGGCRVRGSRVLILGNRAWLAANRDSLNPAPRRPKSPNARPVPGQKFEDRGNSGSLAKFENRGRSGKTMGSRGYLGSRSRAQANRFTQAASHRSRAQLVANRDSPNPTSLRPKSPCERPAPVRKFRNRENAGSLSKFGN